MLETSDRLDLSCIKAYLSYDQNLDISAVSLCAQSAGLVAEFKYDNPDPSSVLSIIRNKKKQNLAVQMYLNKKLQISINPDSKIPILNVQALGIVMEYSYQIVARKFSAK